jgi:hypothetical protein
MLCGTIIFSNLQDITDHHRIDSRQNRIGNGLHNYVVSSNKHNEDLGPPSHKLNYRNIRNTRKAGKKSVCQVVGNQ